MCVFVIVCVHGIPLYVYACNCVIICCICAQGQCMCMCAGSVRVFVYKATANKPKTKTKLKKLNDTVSQLANSFVTPYFLHLQKKKKSQNFNKTIKT